MARLKSHRRRSRSRKAEVACDETVTRFARDRVVGGVSGRLRSATRALLKAPENEVFLSVASVWELGLKIARQKLSLPTDYEARLMADGIDELPVSIAHAHRAMTLPGLHGDPFDRLLIAQALEEGLVLVTSDREIVRYDVPTLDA